MDKYKKLIKNTLTFGIGTFSSKILVFLMMPFYTNMLSTDQYGTVDLITSTCNLIIPVASFGIVSAVIRFALDNSYDKKTVFTSGLTMILIGLGIFLLVVPLLKNITIFNNYSMLIVIFVLTGSLKSLCSFYVRSLQYTKLYTIDGVVGTITTILFNILFLGFFHFKVEGVVLATILSDLLSIIMLTLIAELYKHIDFSRIKTDSSTLKMMLKYSVPLIPTSMFWWITNVSDKYFIVGMVSDSANGLYSAANKVPAIVVMIATIFSEAWKMSAILEKDNKNKELFFSKVFSAYSAILFITSSVIILFTQVITKILVAPSYYESWKFIPVLVLATVFSCLSTFVGSVFVVQQKSVMSMLTVATGAILNIIMNSILIPIMGVQGAAIATFSSYFIVFIMRAITTKKYIKISYNMPRFCLNIALITIQTIVMLTQIKLWIVIEIVITVVIVLFNLKPMLVQFKKMFHR